MAASDPNGFALSYTWQPQSGTITGSGSSVIFTPPSVTGDTVVRVNVTVTNSAGLSVAGVVNHLNHEHAAHVYCVAYTTARDLGVDLLL